MNDAYEMFGLSKDFISYLTEQLPGGHKCRSYKFQHHLPSINDDDEVSLIYFILFDNFPIIVLIISAKKKFWGFIFYFFFFFSFFCNRGYFIYLYSIFLSCFICV